ncbi:hypothetical protein JQ582_39370 [Bradyrhizobium japonicum]|uniref:serpin family protein n=1 Tax=Bradyrhizobium japonicum TaxID=375 RepID=UPI001BA6DFE5|nr:serpin family protein [Bradyrhizobium japonicum]MBR0749988.1 hypothetical protein [Bradyrhizobium japonicum]
MTDSCGPGRAFEKQAVGVDRLRATSAFTLDVLARLAPQSKNVTISPLGLSSVLSTLYLGANEPMRKAITATLRVGPGKVEELRRAARLLELASQRDPRRFVSYNGLFVDHRLPLKAGVSDLAKAESQVDLQSVDFNSKADIGGINVLVDKKTNGRIKSILEPGLAPSLVALNAFVFKDCWKTPFDPAKTTNLPFTRADGSKVDRPTMSSNSDLILYGTSGRFVAVELPYVDEEFALTLVTTQHEPAAISGFKEAGPLLSGVGLAQADASLTLPKFGGATDNELLDVLSSMGMKSALASADQLPGFSQGLKLGRVRQKTWLAVDEKGTEAAAATAAVATRSAEKPKSVKVDFDKPFVFALRHRSTGAILIAGYVADPGEGQDVKKD